MPNTFELIASSTVGSGGAANIEFTSIPGTYTDLVVKLSGRTTRTNYFDNINFRLNGGTTSNSQIYLISYDGTSVLSGSGSANGGEVLSAITGSTATSNTFGSVDVYIPNYAGSNYKSFSADAVTENNATANRSGLTANLYSSTSAVTSINILPQNGTFVQYTTAYLYGVKNA
jgi:hypothetical protein